MRKALEAGGPKVNLLLARSNVGDTVLNVAIQEKNAVALEAVLKHRAATPEALAMPDGKGRTPLMAACKAGNLALMNALLEAKVPLDATDMRGRSAYTIACDDGNLEIFQALLAATSPSWTGILEGILAHLSAANSLACTQVLLNSHLGRLRLFSILRHRQQQTSQPQQPQPQQPQLQPQQPEPRQEQAKQSKRSSDVEATLAAICIQRSVRRWLATRGSCAELKAARSAAQAIQRAWRSRAQILAAKKIVEGLRMQERVADLRRDAQSACESGDFGAFERAFKELRTLDACVPGIDNLLHPNVEHGSFVLHALASHQLQFAGHLVAAFRPKLGNHSDVDGNNAFHLLARTTAASARDDELAPFFPAGDFDSLCNLLERNNAGACPLSLAFTASTTHLSPFVERAIAYIGASSRAGGIPTHISEEMLAAAAQSPCVPMELCARLIESLGARWTHSAFGALARRLEGADSLYSDEEIQVICSCIVSRGINL